jgi:MFS family permease
MDPLRRARIGTTATFALGAAMCAVWIVRIPALVDKLHLDPSKVGIVVLFWGAGALLTMQLTRRLLVRFGTRRALRIFGPASTVTLALIGFANTYAWLLVGAAVFGMAFGVLDIAMNTQAAAIERAYGRHLMNGMHAGWSIGAIIGGIAGALTAAMHVSFSATVIGAAVVVTPIAIALGPSYLAEREEAHDAPVPKGRLPLVVYLAAAIGFAAFMVEGSVADWSGLYLHDHLASTEAVAALGYPAFEVGALIGRLTGDRVRTSLGTRNLLSAAGTATIAAFAIVLAAAGWWVGIVGFFLVGLAVATVVPLAFSIAGDILPARAAASIALTGTFGYTGLLLGPVAIGLLASATSLHQALYLPLVLGLAIALAGRALPKQWRIRAHDPARSPAAARQLP